MRCVFRVDGSSGAEWTEERDDLPLYLGGSVNHEGESYEIVADPRYEVDWDSSSITANILVKAAPTHRR